MVRESVEGIEASAVRSMNGPSSSVMGFVFKRDWLRVMRLRG